MTDQLKISMPRGDTLLGIHRAMAHCCQDNGKPAELWLGPTARLELEKAFNDHLSFLKVNEEAIKLGPDLVYCGMAIKFMEEEGVRVGKTYGS